MSRVNTAFFTSNGIAGVVFATEKKNGSGINFSNFNIFPKIFCSFV
jgi:hypothetical protein